MRSWRRIWRIKISWYAANVIHPIGCGFQANFYSARPDCTPLQTRRLSTIHIASFLCAANYPHARFAYPEKFFNSSRKNCCEPFLAILKLNPREKWFHYCFRQNNGEMMIFGENFAYYGAVIPAEVPPQTIDGHASASDILQILQAHIDQAHGPTQQASASTASLSGGSYSPALMIAPGEGGGGGYYDDYDSGYGWWDSGGGIDYGGSNYYSDGPAPSASDAPRVEYLDGSVAKTDVSNGYVNVYFGGTTSDGKNGDQLVTQNLSNTTSDILAATPNVNFVNVSATTNGVHDTHSDHYSGNAVDINQINGVSVSSQQGTTLALQLEAQALADPHTRYVEGPGGNWARSTEGGQWQRSADLPTMNNHVHWSTFRR